MEVRSVATIALPYDDFKQIVSPNSSKPLYLLELARKVEDLSQVVENDWDSLSEDTQLILKAIAYEALPNQPFSIVRWFQRISWRWKMVFIDDNSVLYWHLALQRLINAVLDVTELENPEYNKDLATVIKLVNEEPDDISWVN